MQFLDQANTRSDAQILLPRFASFRKFSCASDHAVGSCELRICCALFMYV